MFAFSTTCCSVSSSTCLCVTETLRFAYFVKLVPTDSVP